MDILVNISITVKAERSALAYLLTETVPNFSRMLQATLIFIFAKDRSRA